MALTLEYGDLLNRDTYFIIKTLGQGGFGITYLARDLTLDKLVAIKEFFPRDFCRRDDNSREVFASSDSVVDTVNQFKLKFLTEARNLARLDFPGIIRILSAFEENNTAYYVMDYIEGEPLSTLVRRVGPMLAVEAIKMIEGVGEAVDFIHHHRINHFDIKPGNIMLRETDLRPILIDFGLSKQYDQTGVQVTSTPTGISHGYAPLEQYSPDGLNEFSPRTDIYSLAATLYFLMTGVVPPAASQLAESQLTFPKGFPDALKYPISRAMASKRGDRQPSVRRFLDELRQGLKNSEELQIEPLKIQNQEAKEVDDDYMVVPVVIEPSVPPVRNIRPTISEEHNIPEKEPEVIKLEPKDPDNNNTEEKKEGVVQIVEEKQMAIEAQVSSEEQEKNDKTENKAAKASEPELQSASENSEEDDQSLDNFQSEEIEDRSQVKNEDPEPSIEVPYEASVDDSEEKKRFPSIIKWALLGAILGLGAVWSIMFFSGHGNDSLSTPESPTATKVTDMPYETPLGMCLYSGEVNADNLPDGRGEAVFQNSQTAKEYKGHWKDGNMDGKAMYTFVNGDTFDGTFKDNAFEEGKLTFIANGDYYIGFFKDGDMDFKNKNRKGHLFDKQGNIKR